MTLTLGEMERIKGRPKTGHPTLFLLDEFPGLKRMEVIENAVAQAAGFGVKFFSSPRTCLSSSASMMRTGDLHQQFRSQDILSDR